MVSWSGGSVAVEDSVTGVPPLSGAELADRYWQAMHELTFGLVRRRGAAAAAGPVALLRFGEPVIGPSSVEWPIVGGALAAAPGGRWRIRVADGVAVASLETFRPSLPRPLYTVSHLQVHLLFTRLFLLRLRRSSAPPGVRPAAEDRIRAAAVDVALCLTVNRILTRRFRPSSALAFVAAYHVACWSSSGRTLGGVMMRQRVVASDGRPLLVSQAALRLLTAPLSWVVRRPVHDEIAGTDVILDEKEEGAVRTAPSSKSF